MGMSIVSIFWCYEYSRTEFGGGGIAKRVKPLACLIFEGLLNTFQRSCWFSVPTLRMGVPFVYKLAGTCQSLY